MEERWLPVPGYETRYDVSDLGRVRSWLKPDRAVFPRILASFVGSHGYPVVTLWKDGRMRAGLVHTLVAAAFIGPRPPGHDVRHLDGNKRNPRLPNLAYGTHAQNMHDVVRHGQHSGANRTHCKHGHEFTEDNTYRSPGSQRRACRACKRERGRTRHQRRVTAPTAS